MALPKIDSPTFILKLPSTGKQIKFRPFTVKEEKILLFSAQSKDSAEVLSSVSQVISNCVYDKLNIDALPSYDIEFIFINLRAKSVNNVITLQIRDDEDQDDYEVEVDLDEVEVKINPEHKYLIKVSDDVTIRMKDPNFKTISKFTSIGNSNDDVLIEMIAECIDSVMVGEDDVVLMSDHTLVEQKEFIESFGSKAMRELENFFSTVPVVSHDITYTRKDGTAVTKTVEGLDSFFI